MQSTRPTTQPGDTRRFFAAASTFSATFVSQLLGSLIATSFVSGFNRTAVFLAIVPLISMLVCTIDRFRSRYRILFVSLASHRVPEGSWMV